jgi:hypothetical protein
VKTDRLIPSNELDIIVLDGDKGTCLLIDTAKFGKYICDQEKNEKDFKI